MKGAFRGPGAAREANGFASGGHEAARGAGRDGVKVGTLAEARRQAQFL